MEELAKYLRAMLQLDIWTAQQNAERNGTTPPRLELVLADSGFSTKEIADLLGKSVVAVSKAVSRARSARKSAQRDESSVGEGGANGE
jgi:DNA-directed RNA polymerase specialized sigma24 family protein